MAVLGEDLLHGRVPFVWQVPYSSNPKYPRRRPAPRGEISTGEDQFIVANFNARETLKITHAQQGLLQCALIDPS